ncbi:4-hydroxyphenylacetate isomerase [Salipaludibacillus keqinensis]|uniref:4-hydroxyphenylacetate isomerase n=1 Tax=Salipaludibacillus keqinensis TaxID=2045207 RepID=A0A323TI82_9BACI|nr:fumarylacetoacetate hydrolase family protein [Salipaludibacillus keqinensis]PYZ94832.1 4-hydroxyphenylacetate isomerase [Salipaludibacillus keqinensis]
MVKAICQFNGLLQSSTVDIRPSTNEFTFKNQIFQANDGQLQIPVSGTIYGTALNYKGELAAMGDNLKEAPYNAPPIAPVLYIKPINTLSPHLAPIPLPNDEKELQVGAALGIVFKKTATQVKLESALDYVAGFTIVNDMSLPHESIHRPAIKQKARDGFCPIGPWIVHADEISEPDNLDITVYVNNELVQKNSTRNLIRNTKQLIEDVTEFMTLSEGDVLLVGTPENPPLVKEGDEIRINIEGMGALVNTVVSEKEASLLSGKTKEEMQ